MADASPSVDSPLSTVLHRLASLEPRQAPVVSLYLDLRPDQHGRDTHDVFLRRVKAERLKAAEADPDAHTGLARAFEQIEAALAGFGPSANAAAFFAAVDDEGLFTATGLEARLDGHQLFVGPVPHLFPLVRLIDQNPRYAALLVDSNHARIIVFGLGAVESRDDVHSVRTNRHSEGGWSQARYQRHIANLHLQHLKEVVETLQRIVRDDAIDRIIIAGDAGLVARLREQLPASLDAKIVDVLRFDRHAGEAEIVEDALAALRQRDAADDAERVNEVLGAWRAAGLGVAGPDATLRALALGQVDELLIAGTPETLQPVQRAPGETSAPPSIAEGSTPGSDDVARLRLADALVTGATQTGASVRIIEDPELLRGHGGVAAALRFRI
jgi:peptide chain release factor subunit 1